MIDDEIERGLELALAEVARMTGVHYGGPWHLCAVPRGEIAYRDPPRSMATGFGVVTEHRRTDDWKKETVRLRWTYDGWSGEVYSLHATVIVDFIPDTLWGSGRREAARVDDVCLRCAG